MGTTRNRDCLRDYQHHGVKLLNENPFFFLQTKMGGGKTVTTLTALADLIREFMVHKALVISTKNIVTTVWPYEPQQWDHLKHLRVSVIHGTREERMAALNKKADLYCVSRDNIVWLAEHVGDYWPFDMVIYDESDSFKNPSSKRFIAIHGRSPRGKRKPNDYFAAGVMRHINRAVCLSGTPAPNGLVDLWAQYKLLKCYQLGPNITAFRDRWFTYDARKMRYFPMGNAQREISEAVAPYTYVVEDYSGMPDVVYNTVRIPVDEKLAKQFRAFKREKLLELKGTDITALSAGALFGKLCQFSNGAIYDENRAVHEVLDHKLDALADVIEQAQGQPVLVAYAFQHDKDRILKRFKNVVFFNGDKATEDRWNRGEIEIMVAHPASCGHGLNLQYGGSILAWFGLTPNLAFFQQMNARLARSGQKNTVFVHLLVTDRTEDDRLVQMLTDKKDDQETFASLVKQMLTELSYNAA